MDLFITFTCNRQWNNLKPFESSNDRSDLVARIFYEKLKSLLDELICKKVLGKMVSHTFVIEWHKKGLPHAHESKIAIANDIKKIVTAEKNQRYTDRSKKKALRKKIEGLNKQIMRLYEK